MTTHTFYPYRVDASLGLAVDSLDPALKMDANSHYLRLWEVPDESWHLSVTTEVDEDAVRRILPPDERDDPPLALALTLRSDTSRRRLLVDVPFTTGMTRRSLDIHHDDWSGLVMVDLSLVRTNDRRDHDGPWAWAQHAVVGTAPTVRIDVDEPIRPPGDSLRIEWADFNKSPRAWLKAHEDNLFALHTPSYGEAPVLYLNQAIPSAVSVLMSTGTHGRKPRTRDATFQMIVHQVWSSVLGSAMGELADAAHKQEQLDEAMGDLDPWMPQVLRDWAAWLFPQRDADEALQALWEKVSGGDWEKLLIDRLPNAIQSRFETLRGFNGLIKEFDL